MAHKTRPGNVERGWNDPPEFLHTSGGGPPTASAKHTILNKRVVYPGLESGTGSPGVGQCTDPSISPPQSAPPKPPLRPSPVAPTASTNSTHIAPNSDGAVLSASAMTNSPPSGGVVLFPPASSTDIPKFNAPIIVPTMSPTVESPLATIATIATNPINNQQVNVAKGCSELEIPDFESDEQMYHFVLTRLKKTCVDCTKAVKPKVIDDINRKIDIFSDMWKNAKISYPVKSSMARLATALHRRKCDIAHEIHLMLMMDYVSEVGQWMVGIKRLIHEARSIEAPLSPTENTSDIPVLEVTTKALDTESNNLEAPVMLGISDRKTAETATANNEHCAKPEDNADASLSAESNINIKSSLEHCIPTDPGTSSELSSTMGIQSGSELSSAVDALSSTEPPASGLDSSQCSESGPAVIDTTPITD